jgi:hypothetical protein
LYQHLKPIYEARLSVTLREHINQLAKDAYAYVERNYAGLADQKFDQACGYLLDKLAYIGVKISVDEIEAAIQKAWEDFNPGKPKYL